MFVLFHQKEQELLSPFQVGQQLPSLTGLKPISALPDVSDVCPGFSFLINLCILSLLSFLGISDDYLPSLFFVLLHILITLSTWLG